MALLDMQAMAPSRCGGGCDGDGGGDGYGGGSDLSLLLCNSIYSISIC